MIGNQFGRLTVVSGIPANGGLKVRSWVCQCVCGATTTLATYTLRSGNTRSCGCLKLELMRTRAITHGRSRTPEHMAWKLMRQRCLNPNHKNYADYKDRKPSPEFDDFEVFLMEVGKRPSPKHSLDRIDNERGYEIGNVRWATRKEQSNNLRTNVRVNLGTEVVSMAEACRRTGLNYRTVAWRWVNWRDMNRASEGLFESHTHS